MREAAEPRRETYVRFDLRRGMGPLVHLAVVPAMGALLWLAGDLPSWTAALFAIVWLTAPELGFRLLNYLIVHPNSLDVSTLPWGIALPWLALGWRRLARIPFARIASINAKDNRLIVTYWNDHLNPEDPIALDTMKVEAQRAYEVIAAIETRYGRPLPRGNPVAFLSGRFQALVTVWDTHLEVRGRIIPLSAVASVLVARGPCVLVEHWVRDRHGGPVMSVRSTRIRHRDATALAKEIKVRLEAAKGEPT